jgi:putative nucleotidyltransferase with HDIG domain
MNRSDFDLNKLQISIEEVIQELSDLPTLPAIKNELLFKLEDDSLSLETITEKISLDQSLTAKVLKLANSSHFGMNSKVITIQQAVALLGIDHLKNIIRTSILQDHLPKVYCRGFDNKIFWRHNIATAICAELISRTLHLKAHFAFTAGLLHDIGKLVLAAKFSKKYEHVLAYAKENDCQLLEVERFLLGIDHASVGLILAIQWNFSDVIQDAIRGHHEPDDAELNSIVHIIHVANAIVHGLDLNQDPNDRLPFISQKAWDHLNLSDSSYLSIFHETELRFEAINQIID